MPCIRNEKASKTSAGSLAVAVGKVSALSLLLLLTLCFARMAWISRATSLLSPLPQDTGRTNPGAPALPRASVSLSPAFSSAIPFSCNAFEPQAETSWECGAVVIDGPWTSLPAGAGAGLALDEEESSLTLRTEMTNLAFVAQPDPHKLAFPNTVWDLGSSSGRLYLGYGDLYNNRGPVDIVSYDPRSGALLREVLDVPEEQLGGWQATADGQLYVAGQDAQESQTFGNFYLHGGLGWQKRRTIYKGLHVHEVVEFKGRLYAAYGSDGHPPVTYTFALVSGNQGASWSYEALDWAAVQDCTIDALASVSHTTGAFLYATLYRQPVSGMGGERLYRFDGQSWSQVTISGPRGAFTPLNLFPFGAWLLVRGQDSGGEAVFALDGQTQVEVAFLRGKSVWWSRCAVHEGWLYYLDETPFGTPPSPPDLYRTRDLQAWERVGTITLLPGAKPVSIAFAHGRLYVGASNAGWSDGTSGVFELDPTAVYAIANASLQWEAVVPSGAQLSLKIRTATSFSGLFSQPWVEPDGTGNSAFTQSGQALHSMHNGHTWLQVTVYKTANGSGQWPLLKWVKLETSNGSVTLAVDEGPGLYAATNSTDPNGAEYLSPVFRLAEPMAGDRLLFERVTPPGTSVRFQVRSAPSEGQLAQSPFVGPDGMQGSFYQTNGQRLWAGHDGDTYVQYRALLSSSNSTLAPFLHKVVIVAQSNALSYLSIEPATLVWRAGEPIPITVTARSADGLLLPITSKAILSARDVTRHEFVPIEPKELTLISGTGTVDVSLHRAASTRVCVSLAGRMRCCPVVTVQPGAAVAISITTNLAEPHSHWSPVGQVGQPFTLTLTILDRYHNIVTGYAGTVQCQCWRWAPVGAQLPPPYAFQPSDQGYHQFSTGVTIPNTGEWNLVCFDTANPHIAGTQTVNIQP